MSKINDLIKKMCPNGVEYKQLNEIADTFIGLATSVTKHKTSDGVILLHNSDIKQNKIVLKTIEFIDKGFADKNVNKYYQYHDIATVHTGDVGTSAVIEEEYVGSMGFTTLVTRIYDFNYINPYYLCHYFNSQLFKNDVARVTISDRSNLNQKEFCQLLIPIPPIEVQNEIVRILNKFGELEVELEAELEARKSQYEFWRGKVFDKIDAKLVKLSDLCKIGDGLHGTPVYLDDGDYYFINGNNLMNGKIIYDEKTKKVSKTSFDNQNIKLDKNTLLMSINGTIGKVSYYDDEKIMLGKSVAYFNILDEKILSKKFLFYLLQAPKSIRYYNDSLTGSTILNLGLKALREFEIPLPPIEEQNKISNVLEHFDKLINDIFIGLPAEIELRRKQYEYYRNKLLSFEELVNE